MLGLGNSLITSGAPSERNVLSIRSLNHWFKYNEELGLGDGDELVTWGDSFRTGAWTTAVSVLKNSGDLDFDTNNGRMVLDTTWNPGTFSAYVVCRVTTASISNEEIMNSDNSNFFTIRNSTTMRIKIGDTTANDIALPGDAISQNTWVVIGIEWDGGTIRVYQDSDYATPTTGSDSDTFAGITELGKRGNPFDGQIREIVLFDDVLSTEDRELLMVRLEEIKNL